MLGFEVSIDVDDGGYGSSLTELLYGAFAEFTNV